MALVPKGGWPPTRDYEAAATTGADAGQALAPVMEALFNNPSEPYIVVRAGTNDPRMKIISDDDGGKNCDEVCFAMGADGSFLHLELFDLRDVPNEHSLAQLQVAFQSIEERRPGRFSEDTISKLKLAVSFQCEADLAVVGEGVAHQRSVSDEAREGLDCINSDRVCPQPRKSAVEEDAPVASTPSTSRIHDPPTETLLPAKAAECGLGEESAPDRREAEDWRPSRVNVVGGLLTAVIVITAMFTVPASNGDFARRRGVATPQVVPPPHVGPNASALEDELRQLRHKVQEEEALTKAAQEAATGAQEQLERTQEAARAAQARSDARLREVEAKLKDAQAAAAAERPAAREKQKPQPKLQPQHSAHRGSGGVARLVNRLPCQRALSLLLGVAGVCSLLGPDSVARVFIAAAGIVSGSLVAAGSAGYFVFGGTQEDAGLMDCVADLVAGGAPVSGYLLWFVLLAAGIWRWVSGFSVILCAWADEVSPNEVHRAPMVFCHVEEIPPEQFEQRPLERPLLTIRRTASSPWLPRIDRQLDSQGQVVSIT